jgi:phage-related holin
MKSFLTNLLASEPFLFLKGALIFLIGPLDLQLAYLLLAVGIDLIFGIQVAVMEKKFKWSILFTKVRRKFIIYGLWITMFHAFDVIAGLPDTARWSVVVMLAGMEILSAVRNTAALGHSKLAEALEQVYLTLTKALPQEPPAKEPQPGDAAKGEPTNQVEGGVTDEQAK